MALMQPEGLVHGHYECRSLDETLPVFTDLLAAEVVERRNDLAVVKHPNTELLLIVHEGGTDAPDKPSGNHYGFRVADHTEVEAAWDYISQHQDEYGIRSISKPSASHFAYSTYLNEPGGNTLEIEYYNPRAAIHGRNIAAQHWTEPLSADRFPGRGYVPQALSHGTLQCDDKQTSNQFYTDVLGLAIVGGGQRSTYIGHPDTPWYLVVQPEEQRDYLRPVNRFTLKLTSPSAVAKAHERLGRLESGVTELGELEESSGEAHFLLSDLDSNWWEITSTAEA